MTEDELAKLRKLRERSEELKHRIEEFNEELRTILDNRANKKEEPPT